MASITISPVYSSVTATSEITGNEKILIINQNGKPSTIEVNQILDKMDDDISANVEAEVMASVNTKIDGQIEESLKEAIDDIGKLTWNEV